MTTSVPSTPLGWAARIGLAIVPAFLVLGLLLGVLARAWMRVISTEPEFTLTGSLSVVLGFAFFAVMQSVAGLAAERPWRDWSRRGARLLGVLGLLPLFVAAGAVMAPAVILTGMVVWHPTWPRSIRWVLGLLGLANLAAVSVTIAADWGVSLHSFVGVVGLVVIYGCIVWAAEGTFSRPRSAATDAPATSTPLLGPSRTPRLRFRGGRGGAA